jgi:SAM-dependent methyltransferase
MARKSHVFVGIGISALVCAVMVFTGSAISQDYGEDYDVPYVPTEQKLVEKMLEMGEVTKDDIVYDLGCGDGRIVISAALYRGARGVGIDINPTRIEESIANSEKAKVTDRVKFIQSDLFEADISEATVVTLYLLPSVNIRLRPKLFAELKPGTRIVSHDFDMDEWTPDNSVQYDRDTDFGFSNNTVYFWVLPANVSGVWSWMAPGGSTYRLTVDQTFQEVSGTLTDGRNTIPLTDISIDGDRFTFNANITAGGSTVSWTFEGTVDGDTVRGSMKAGAGQGSSGNQWTAVREPSTKKSIDGSEK